MARQSRRRVVASNPRRLGRVFLREYKDRSGRPRIESVYTLEYYVPGPKGKPKRIRQSSGESDQAKAVDELKRRQGEVAAGSFTAKSSSNVTFETIFDLLREHYAQNGRTLQPRPKLESHFKEWRVSHITDLEIASYRRKRLKDGAKRATINRETQALHQSFRLARIARLVLNVPLFPPRLREDNARKGFFEWDDFNTFVAALPAHYRPLANIAYRTGWRLNNELLTRQWSHVRLDLKTGWLRLDTGETKNGEGRTFPMTTELLQALKDQRAYVSKLEKEKERVIPWVFVQPDGFQMRSIRAAWSAAATASGVKRLPHDLRRTAVRTLEEAGVDRPAAMKMVGHKTEEMYRRYAIVDQKVMDRAKEKMMSFETERADADKSKAS